MTTSTLGDIILGWAEADPAVVLCVLIGSQARPAGTAGAADDFSDWDFQVATTQPERFATGEWLAALGLPPLAYVLRPGRLGSAHKVSAVTPGGELDLVVIPAEALRTLAQLVAAGAQAPQPPLAAQALTDLAAVLAGGFRIVKGAEEFARFYDRVAGEIPPPRLDDAAAIRMAEGFVCDYVFTRRKIDRGETLAARRWLHHQLVETNFRLLHELRRREGAVSFPDARRIETLADPRVTRLAAEADVNPKGIRLAVEDAATQHRDLMAALVGGKWRWPDLAGLRLRAE